MSIRPERPGNAAAVSAIYNEGIAGRSATFETRMREPAEIDRWAGELLPFIVACDGPRAVRASPA